MYPSPAINAPAKRMYLGPILSTSQPEIGPSMAPSARDKEKISEVWALVMSRSRVMGRKKTANP